MAKHKRDYPRYVKARHGDTKIPVRIIGGWLSFHCRRATAWIGGKWCPGEVWLVGDGDRSGWGFTADAERRGG